MCMAVIHSGKHHLLPFELSAVNGGWNWSRRRKQSTTAATIAISVFLFVFISMLFPAAILFHQHWFHF